MDPYKKHFLGKRQLLLLLLLVVLATGGGFLALKDKMGISTQSVRQISAIKTDKDMPFMHSVGVNTLISDSGVIRYRIVAEEWDIFTPADEADSWRFIKGLLMQRLDERLEVDLYVQADTAYLHQQTTWELRGRVRIRNVQGTRFRTEELFWNINKHEMWNHAPMTIITPDRTLHGTEFRSNEQMTRYSVANSQGEFPMSDAETPQDTLKSDTTEMDITQQAPAASITPPTRSTLSIVP